jgi:hypothetical protein
MTEPNLIPAEEKHIRFMNAIKAVQVQHLNKLTPIEMVMVLAQAIGATMAALPAGFDQNEAVETVSQNIAAGNMAAVNSMLSKPPGKAN